MKIRFDGGVIRTLAAAVTLSSVTSTAILAQPLPAASTPAAEQPASANLSASQLEALVAPIGGVPQSMVPALMDACRYPADIAEAAAALARPEPELKATWNTGVQFLARYAPDLLGILARDLRATAALGDAYARQPNDVWRALGAVDARSRGVQAAATPATASAAPGRTQAGPPGAAAPSLQSASPSQSTQAAPSPAGVPAATLPPCEAYASPLRGAARGAARGAVVGAISENAGRGAAIGAAAGGVGGAARRGAARRSGACY